MHVEMETELVLVELPLLVDLLEEILEDVVGELVDQRGDEDLGFFWIAWTERYCFAY
jgi:hypothetical protein